MIDKLERRFGRFAIPNVTLFLIAGQVLAFLAIQRNSDARQTLELIPQEVLNGEVQRIVTFLFLPPSTSLLWAFFSWYLFYLMGTALEHYWGSFRYNVFLLIGYCATVAVSFLTPEGSFENYFVELTVFLAFAYLNPYFELRLFFVLPVQIRWFAILTWTGYAVGFISGGWTIRLGIAAAVLNFFIFFGRDLFQRMLSGRREMAKQAKRFGAQRREPDYFHVCDVCGITDKSHPEMDFRYCSQCSGNRAYCSDHLKEHKHVLDEPE